MDLTDWKDAFIKLSRRVTIDEAALVAASINPLLVNSSISEAMRGGFDNWERAVLVARLLQDAVLDMQIEAVSATFHVENWSAGQAELILNPRQYIEENPLCVLLNATFRGHEVWQWMVYHGLIDPKYDEQYSPSRERIIANMKAANASKSPANQDDEQLKRLINQVTELTTLLQEAETEIAALKVGIPHFRHMTPALRLVAEVQERYWGDNWEPNTIPKQFTILHELENIHGLSNAKAKNVEYVASPIDRVTGKNLCS